MTYPSWLLFLFPVMGRLLVVGELLRPRSAVSTWVDQWVDLERFTGLLRKVLTHLWRFGGGSLLVTACYSSVTAGHWYSSSVDYGLY